MSRFSFISVALALSTALPGATAFAQVDVGFLAGQSAQMGTSMYLANMVGRQSAARMRDRGGPAPRPLIAPAASLTYRPSPQVTRQSLQRFVERARRIDRADGDRAAKMFAAHNPFDTARAWMGRYGLSHANVADCVTVYLATAWMTAHGSNADPSRAQIVGIRAQVADALRLTPQLARASDAVKQEMAESNLLQAMAVGDLGTYVAKNPSALPQVRSGVLRGARSAYGIDLMAVRLSNAGLVPA